MNFTMKYLKRYKNINEYYDDSERFSGESPYTSYVLTNFETGDEVIFGVREDPHSGTASVMWIDDFPDGMDYSPYSTFEEYFEAYMETLATKGSNRCTYTGEQIEYDDETYYLWTYDDYNGGNYDMYYCLTSTIDYKELYNMSMEKDITYRNCPLYAILTEDFDPSSYIPMFDDEQYTLVKVEKEED